MSRAEVNLLPITPAPPTGTPTHHQDPFDRFPVAQADTDRLSLVSADSAMRRYEIDVLW